MAGQQQVVTAAIFDMIMKITIVKTWVLINPHLSSRHL